MKCCIAECKSAFKNGVRSHCIPTTHELRQRWLETMKIINPGPNDRICSKHFTPNDYQGYQLQFDDDICADERRFYLKLFPLVNLVREKRTHCTSCNVHLGTAPAYADNVKMHPILRVTQCKKCHDFYNSGEFSKGEDGSELYCRWCGQGGEVYCCAKCPYVFCKACIGGNLAKSLVADIRDNENWSCFVCSPKITWPIRAVHWALKNYIAKQKESILLTNTNEIEIRRLMKKDTSTCCRSKITAEGESSNDSDNTPLKKTYSAGPLLKKRKRSNEEIIGQPKPKILNSILTGGNNSGSNNTNNTNSGINSTATPKTTGVAIAPKNQTLQLNSGLVIQKHPTTASTSNSGTALLRPIQSNQTQVKIVQLTNQQNKTVNVPLNVQNAIQSSSAPPPLLIRNRGVQIRQHVVPGSVQNRSIQRSTTSSTATSTTSSSLTNNEHTPVYHTIGGFCIDLNSAAQHDSIRLPNGKLIQVKKSSNNTNQSTATISQRNQIPSGILHQQPSQPQQHFTITQPIQQQQQHHTNSGGNIQTIAASAIIPNATGSLQILNGNVIQQIQNQQQQHHPSNIIRPTTGPLLVRNTFPNTAVGKARNQLQTQIFTAMEICQHLSGKIQTLTNSNPYKNANNHIDVKELYIHLSYLFTYAIGRFKNLQDKCNEDMTSMGFNTDVSKLTKGQLAAEKYASDGDEDEIEIVEPKTTTIDLDSDDDDVTQSINNKKSNDTIKLGNVNLTTLKELHKQQVAKQHQLLRDKQNQQAFKLQQMQEKQKINLHQSEDNDYHLPLSLLAGMLEVELTEGNDSLNSTSSGSSLPKKPRKKTTNKPNPHLIKQQKEQLRSKYDEIKRCDIKLKQECTIVIDPLDLDIDDVKAAFQRYSEQQNDNDDDSSDYEIMNAINNNNDINSSANFDDNTVEVMQLLEVTMDGGDELNSSKTDDELNKSIEQLDKIKIDKNPATMEENEKIIEIEEKMETDTIITDINNENNLENTIDNQNNSNEEETENDNQKEELKTTSEEETEQNCENILTEVNNDINLEKCIDNQNNSNEEETENDNQKEKEELKTTSEEVLKTSEEETDQNYENILDNRKEIENFEKETKAEKENTVKEIEEENAEKEAEVEKENDEKESDNIDKTKCISEDSELSTSSDNFVDQHNNLDTKETSKEVKIDVDNNVDTEETSKEVKLDNEVSLNEIKSLESDSNLVKLDNFNSIVHESNVPIDTTLDNWSTIDKEENYEKSNVELKEISKDSINITDDIMSTEHKSPVDNGNTTPTHINTTDITDEPAQNSNMENESNINKMIDSVSIEPMDVDTNLLNIENPSELIDELLADAVKTKSAGDDDCPNDFIDQQLSDSLLPSE